MRGSSRYSKSSSSPSTLASIVPKKKKKDTSSSTPSTLASIVRPKHKTFKKNKKKEDTNTKVTFMSLSKEDSSTATGNQPSSTLQTTGSTVSSSSPDGILGGPSYSVSSEDINVQMSYYRQFEKIHDPVLRKLKKNPFYVKEEDNFGTGRKAKVGYDLSSDVRKVGPTPFAELARSDHGINVDPTPKLYEHPKLKGLTFLNDGNKRPMDFAGQSSKPYSNSKRSNFNNWQQPNHIPAAPPKGNYKQESKAQNARITKRDEERELAQGLVGHAKERHDGRDGFRIVAKNQRDFNRKQAIEHWPQDVDRKSLNSINIRC